MRHDRYLLSKAWGYGFFSDVMVTLGHLLIADLTGRTPVVHWGKNSLFAGEGDGNAFTQFFEPVSGLSLADLERPTLRFFPDKWRHDNLHQEDLQKWEGAHSRMRGEQYLGRDEDVLVCDFYTAFIEIRDHLPKDSPWAALSPAAAYRRLIEKYLRPLPELIEAAKGEKERLLGNSPAVAVHFRGTDKIREIAKYKLEFPLQAFFDTVEQFLTSHGCDRIYLMSDDERAVRLFRERFGDLLACTDAARAAGTLGVHYLKPGARAGREVLIDALIALNCEAFVGYGLSNPSCYIHAARDWGEKGCLLGWNMLEIKNKYVYRRSPPPAAG